VYTNKVEFEWDEDKNIKNFRKHGIWFEEAVSVFDDPYAREIADHEHSDEEDRWIILGFSSELHLLIVCYVERQAGKIIRPISARKATPQETLSYQRLKR